MAGVTAAAVKQLREKTGLPLMDCKKALTESNGDEEAAIVWLRENGAKVMAKRSDRETAFGRFGLYGGPDKPVGAIVELRCESAPVTQNEEFVQLANDLAEALATGPGATTAEELLAQPSPSRKGMTLGEQKDELFNRIREVFNVGRIRRIDGTCASYSHNAATVAGVLLEYEGDNGDAARDICMHIAAMRPAGLTNEDIDPEVIERERQILRELTIKEGKPEAIVDKIVDGKVRAFLAERVLTAQPFVKDSKLTVSKFAEESGIKLKQFVSWELSS